jgi:hypothetical protein
MTTEFNLNEKICSRCLKEFSKRTIFYNGLCDKCMKIMIKHKLAGEKLK